MGNLFNYLIEGLGSILGFFYDLLDGVLDEGVALGLAIVLLTIVVNLIVFPLTLKQTRATRAFTEIQPEIKRIQKEYKDDPQEMQKKLMELQKSAGATPGGCLLPLLVQMPIWFALFRLLQTPEQYINAESALGLALADDVPKTFLGMDLFTSPAEAVGVSLLSALPYLIMIVLMVATQYVQQWHATYGQERPAGQPGAGAQQAITKIMPLFIGFISWNFPAGLIIYWATGNLFRLGQQALIFRMDGRPTPVSRPTEEPKEAKGPKETKETKEAKAIPASEEAQAKKPQQGAADKRRRRRRR
ncbi:MAG TPA: YidC/Oxa1 family membrane protein insertase [Acidimicrobiia bacterium]|nr:YidC/Oxa1 family membrane protein insertase [Acidimicrobiia bacterium]